MDKIKEEQTKLYNDMMLFNQEKQEFSSYKISIEEQAVKKVQQRKDELKQEGRIQMVNELPIILRWLVKRHLSRKKKKS